MVGGPDEDFGYVIDHTVPSENQPWSVDTGIRIS
jgi:hypothetical protein